MPPSSNGPVALPIAPTSHSHDHHEHSSACCTHHEMQSERYLLLYLIGGMLLLGTAISKWFFAGVIDAQIADIPAAIGAILLGFPLFLASFKEIRAGRASSSSLAS